MCFVWRMTSARNPEQPKWLAPLAYVTALPVAAALLLLREEPWTKGSVAGLALATCMAVGVTYVSLKTALGLPVSDPQLSIYGSSNKGWFDRGWGIAIQLSIIGCAGALLALFF